MPKKGALDISNLNVNYETLDKLLTINTAQWKSEVENIREFYKIFDSDLPAELTYELNELEKRLN